MDIFWLFQFIFWLSCEELKIYKDFLWKISWLGFPGLRDGIEVPIFAKKKKKKILFHPRIMESFSL